MNKYFTKGVLGMPNMNYNWNNPNQIQPNSYSTNPYNYSRSYQQYQPTTQQQQVFYPNTQQNNIIWVKGKENARSMQLPPNSTVVLLDSEVGKFYIKTTDDIGLGKLRIFSYVEQPDIDSSKEKNSIQSQEIDLSNYVTKNQLQKALEEMKNNESLPIVKSTTNVDKQKHSNSAVNTQF